RIAVVIPHYRQGEFLEECLASIAAQTRPADEIVVVDSSPEQTAKVIGRFNIKYVVQPPAGVAAARNAGLAASSCELVSFLDADNVATPDRLERQAAAFESGEGIVLCHGALVPIDRM